MLSLPSPRRMTPQLGLWDQATSHPKLWPLGDTSLNGSPPVPPSYSLNFSLQPSASLASRSTFLGPQAGQRRPLWSCEAASPAGALIGRSREIAEKGQTDLPKEAGMGVDTESWLPLKPGFRVFWRPDLSLSCT